MPSNRTPEGNGASVVLIVAMVLAILGLLLLMKFKGG